MTMTTTMIQLRLVAAAVVGVVVMVMYAAAVVGDGFC
jgi:hypothetical protein